MSHISNDFTAIPLSEHAQSPPRAQVDLSPLNTRASESARKILVNLEMPEIPTEETLTSRTISPATKTGSESPLSITESPSSDTSGTGASPLSTAYASNVESQAELDQLQPRLDLLTAASEKTSQILAKALPEMSPEEEDLSNELDALTALDLASTLPSSLPSSSTTTDTPEEATPRAVPLETTSVNLQARFARLRAGDNLAPSWTPPSTPSPAGAPSSAAKAAPANTTPPSETTKSFNILKKSHPSERELMSIPLSPTFIALIKRAMVEIPVLKGNPSLKLKITANLQKARVLKNALGEISKPEVTAELKQIDTKLCKMLNYIFSKPKAEQPAKMHALMNILYPQVKGEASDVYQARIQQALKLLLAGPSETLHTSLLLLAYTSIKELPLSEQYKTLGLIRASFTEIGFLLNARS
ncbi:MAG: hypothetical protein NTX49_07880 [Chlamydiae bacterium]|nr:hypothetical protein [Chlamydiota bacterium]